ncbi:MAG: tyrosine-type recombinase/integrase [Actinophytocola sp.]|uniref:tyrosine-type recombinase/integrase n=1 Tax=Actinophytocola sp. TaxID=1872138 RepID=UPI003C77B380
MSSGESARLARARRVLAELGVEPIALLTSRPRGGEVAPTVGAFLSRMRAAATPTMIGSYGTYWSRAEQAWGTRRIDEIRASDILAWMRQLQQNAQHRGRGHRDGRHAAIHGLHALRAFYRLAVADGLLDPDENPAARVRLPRRLPSTRRALTTVELAAINQVVATTGRDPALDCLLLRLHTETACRRGGAVALRLADLDAESGLVRLCEKGGTQRWQPVSPTLAAALTRHATCRGVHDPEQALLRHADGRPLSYRRYDRIWERVRDGLPWAAAQGVSTHWLRHTTITWVERHFGYGIARAYAGHTDSRGASTTTYIRARLPEVAAALAALTGEPHPLAQPRHPGQAAT